MFDLEMLKIMNRPLAFQANNTGAHFLFSFFFYVTYYNLNRNECQTFDKISVDLKFGLIFLFLLILFSSFSFVEGFLSFHLRF